MAEKRVLNDEDITTTWMRGASNSAGLQADPDGTDTDGTDTDGTDGDSGDTDTTDS
ncbi:MAG: hypothetical protein QOG54_418 [Actinomycetota bacterium]|jgi:hypothetical protein|nr:hypothetical protein [Actinomycetota bacterium]